MEPYAASLADGQPTPVDPVSALADGIGISAPVSEMNAAAVVAVPEVLADARLPYAPEWIARLDRGAKRALDIVVAVVLLVVFMPLIVLLAIAIKLDSRGPTFFRCERMGYRGARLMMLKFRKMREGATGVPLTLSDDNRFTRIGSWLARRKLDELPQLWHVLRGHMSLVGPRPECARFTECFPHEYQRILSIRPGVIGLSQLVFLDEGRMLNADDPVGHYIEEILPQKVEMDLWYLERRSLSLDLRILGWTALALVLRRPIAVDCSTGRMRVGKR
jgi:lipopolysaccharide/colanic/teichoic acid biosynthesis glycosyltransferase